MNKSAVKNLDVLFIVPPLFRFIGIDMQSYPLGLGYMVSYLKKDNIRSLIYNSDYMLTASKTDRSRLKAFLKKVPDLLRTFAGRKSLTGLIARHWPDYYVKVNNPRHTIWTEFRIVLKKINPKIIGISSRIVDISSTLIMARIAKDILPDVKIVVGGATAASASEYVIKNDCIDFIVVGEGEETMLELSRYILGRNNSQDPSYIRGIVYRLGDKTVRTPPRPLIENLDDIPFPDREAVFVLDRYKQIITVYQNLDVLSSRGCPYRCKFCCAYLVWGTRKFRLRSVDNIIEELIILNRIYGQQSFVFWDDLFSLNKKRVMELCEKMIEQRLAIRWICLLRLDAIDSEMLDMMKRAGCTQIQIGIESGNDRILKHIGKNITLSQIYAKVPIIQRSGLEWLIFLVVGFPSETEDEINDTLRLISDIQPSQVGMSIFAPYPGTAFYNDLKEKGLLGDDIMKSDTWYPYNNFTGTIPDERFVKISINALEYADRYNLRKQLDRLTLKYVIAQLRNFWQQSDH